THEHQELLQKEKDEQRRLREQIREEERAQREWEKARRDAEEQEARTAQALADVKAQLERARAEDAGKYAERIAQLEAELAEAHARGERAKSMAEQTKCGHVYIISNIGSFGEGIYKIGMTRREDPMERVKELGDASVPFLFDVHGLIYSDDAPNLESELHGIFADRRVNLVNERKEFFRVSMDDIVTQCKQMGLEVELTLLAEAKEYRQTEALRNERMASLKSANAIGAAVIEYVPAATEDDTLFEDKEEDD
ncbi:MAG: GIY-YIG nuclease family protein, partial [Planctomycetes bacterium]|nr:GIY-YIG nuclease family protein [Planctomycetota bacterium]